MRKKRTKKETPFKRVILIYCDGITEKYYLHSLKADKYHWLTIEIKPGLGASDNFETVFNEIEQLLATDDVGQYQRIFYLKDMDTVFNQGKILKFQALVDKLKRKKHAKNRLYVIGSRPCIEFWFLLHYDGNDRLLNNYEEAKKELCRYLNDYSKEKKYSEAIYNKLQERIDEAIVRSKAICDKKREPSEEYSYTLMHQVIEELDKLKG